MVSQLKSERPVSRLTPQPWLLASETKSVIAALTSEGAEIRFVGGCVRDSLVGIKAKDFDVSTDATPEEIRKIFRSSRIIGKRFRLVHVFSRNELIEVSTFRANAKGNNSSGVKFHIF